MTDKSEVNATRVCKSIFVGMAVLVWVELEHKLDAHQNIKLKVGIS